jgi:tRNA threonylcarbamoyladenosine biosynthesis protein TsaB
LGIETSSRICSAAVLYDNGASDEISEDAGITHSDILVSIIDELLERNGISVRDLKGIAVGTGPGSFTGIRIGVSFARALSQCAGLPVTGINSIDGLANNMAGDKSVKDGDWVCPAINAMRGEVYTAIYRKKKGGIVRGTGYVIIKIEELVHKLKKTHKVFMLGDAVDIHEAVIKKGLKNFLLVEKKRYPSALSVASMGTREFGGRKAFNYNRVLPTYIREPEAEVKWKKTRNLN